LRSNSGEGDSPRAQSADRAPHPDPLPVRTGRGRRHKQAFSRRGAPEFAGTFRPEKSEGAGNAGRSLRPQPCVRNKKAHKHSHHGHTGITRHSLRDGFTAYSALSPVSRASCHRRLRKLPLADLTPASGRQDHTILPSASQRPRQKRHLASTASRPAFVTIASRPCVGRDGVRHTPDLHFGKTEIFFRKGLDKRPNAKSQTAPDGQITCGS
jgi:hypothetical protein